MCICVIILLHHFCQKKILAKIFTYGSLASRWRDEGRSRRCLPVACGHDHLQPQTTWLMLFNIDTSCPECLALSTDEVEVMATFGAGSVTSDNGPARRAVRSAVRTDRLAVRQSSSYHLLDGRRRKGDGP